MSVIIRGKAPSHGVDEAREERTIPFDRPRRRPSRRAMALLLAEPALAALAGLVVVASVDRRLAAAAAVTATVLVLTAERAGIPRYERLRSHRPQRRTALWVGAGLLSTAAAGLLTPADLRVALVAAATALAVPLGARLVHGLNAAPPRTLLIGDRVAVTHLLNQWLLRRDVELVGICLVEPDDDVAEPQSAVMGVPIVGGLDDAADASRQLGVGQVVVAPGPALTAYDVRRLSWALEDSSVELTVAADVHGAVPHRIEPRLLGRRLLLSVRPSRHPAHTVAFKGAADRLAGALLLALLGPVMLALVALVRMDSAGPGIFRQQRAGRAGTLFTMYKLRTMATDAEERRVELEQYNEGAGPLFKMANDPRVTRVGAFLRRTSLDELPQLVNVAKGEMSLIGPRPALPEETDEYDAWIRRRLAVKPGMTGAWQVSGRSALGWNESVRLDLDYVDNWTLRGDLGIASRTVAAVLQCDGAL